MTEWQVKIEKLIVKIEKDVEYLVKDYNPSLPKQNQEGIVANRWTIGILFTVTLALLGGIYLK
jgi:hypothetical protein